MLSFYKELFKNPKAVGAICPSSKRLARAMAACIPASQQEAGLIVEFGGGTGVFTQALLDRGIPEQQIIVIENSKYLSDTLSQRFPKVEIIHGSAENLDDLIDGKINDISTILSSLPLLSLSEKVRRGIFLQTDKALKNGGHFINITYRSTGILDQNPTYKKVHSKRVLLNIPPSRIDVYKKINSEGL